MAIQHDGWSIVAQYRKCGKGGCKACAEGQGHGPYYYGTKTVDGRRVSRYFGKHAPSENTQDNSQETAVAMRAELNALREDNTRLRALVEELQGQLAKGSPADPVESEGNARVVKKDAASVKPNHDNKVHSLTANQQAVLSALREECGENGWITALSLGRRMGLPNRLASSRTLPVLRRLATLGYAEEIERNKFKPVPGDAKPQSPLNALVIDDTQELTREQVDTFWAQETAQLDADPEVVRMAYDSFIRGLFRNTQDEHTRIRNGSGRRPYVCPFRTSGRGAHRTFADPVRLVRTAVPWVVNNVASQRQRSADMKRQSSALAEHHRERYQRMPLPELVKLRGRMESALEAESNLGWTLSLDEIREQLQFVDQVLVNRGE